MMKRLSTKKRQQKERKNPEAKKPKEKENVKETPPSAVVPYKRPQSLGKSS